MQTLDSESVGFLFVSTLQLAWSNTYRGQPRAALAASFAVRLRGAQEDVAGVTLLALGNGMPDVMTACSSINKAESPLLGLKVQGSASLGCRGVESGFRVEV